MQKRDPDGYRKLLAYQKAQALHSDVLELIGHFPKTRYKETHYRNMETKTIADLADQMPRSGRSTHKNIVEGWKRNTTQEYYDFLSYSIGSNAELKDDAADIATGKYKELMGIKGVMGEKGNPFHPSDPLIPFTLKELDSLKFYPLDQSLPPAVKIYLQAKEVDYLLHRLQQSLDIKMDQEHAKPMAQSWREIRQKEKQNDADFLKYLESLGLHRLEDGRIARLDQ